MHCLLICLVCKFDKVILSFNVGHLLNFKHSTPNFECEHTLYTTDLLRIDHKYANWDVPIHRDFFFFCRNIFHSEIAIINDGK